ncbi:hypothetical protein DLM78_18915 [Leptospira stimsonii]|uniref:Uncharacterized protein n=1 Tax=Leptospira stimsonii TaxID=2202203 RepID=A0A8B3CL00_9LEPT|nr:hypothetical protein DLM78_18915 [Leptospira stimsonii]
MREGVPQKYDSEDVCFNSELCGFRKFGKTVGKNSAFASLNFRLRRRSGSKVDLFSRKGKQKFKCLFEKKRDSDS